MFLPNFIGSICTWKIYLNPQIRISDFWESDTYWFPRITVYIRESVDSLCRDDADMPMPPYIRKAYNCPNATFVSLFK